jgi:lipoate-protein ligase B
MRSAYLLDLPPTEYEPVLEAQRKAVAARKDRRLDRDLIIVLEHKPVFTLGRRGGRENLLVSEDQLKARGIDVVPIERGGDITYHGPGQLVVYAILSLKEAGLSVTGLVAGLERVMVDTAACWGLHARGDDTFRGAWIGQRKLGSIGITIRRGISFHGLALNVNTDLEPFGWINPCGIQGCRMTSLAGETGGPVDMQKARREAIANLASILDLRLERISMDEFERIIS